MKFKKVLIGVALAVTCLMSAQAQRRHEIQVPNPDGYTTLKCDFHMHTVFFRWPGMAYRTRRRSVQGRTGRHFFDGTH